MNQQFMKEKKIVPLVLQMSVPMILSMSVNALYNIVDSYFVAKISQNAMTALSIVFPVQNMINAIAVGFGIGLNAMIAYSIGANEEKKANQIASTGVFLSMIHGIILTICFFIGMPAFMQHFTKEQEIINLGLEYANWVLLFTVIIQVSVVYEKIFQSVGRMKVSMCSMMVGFIVNIVLDPIMIFGFGKFPAMGMKGAAIATGIGQVCTLIAYLSFYFMTPIPAKTSWKYIRFENNELKSVYGIGIPATLNMALPSVLISALNTILTAFGDTYILILGIYYKLQTFIYLSANGIIQGIRPLISYNYGAGQWERVKKITGTAEVFIIGIMLFGTVACQFFPKQLISIYSEDAAIVQYGVTALTIISLGFAISSLSVLTSGVCEALGKGLLSLIISLIRYIVVIIPASVIFSKMWDANGVYVAFVFTEFTAALISALLMKKVLKKG